MAITWLIYVMISSMLDIQFIRENAEVVKQAAIDKQLNPKVVDELLVLDDQRRQLIPEVEQLRKAANDLQRQIKGRKPTPDELSQGKELKEQLRQLEPKLKEVENSFRQKLYFIPNVPAQDVPIGQDETGNQVVRQEGAKPDFDFNPQTHDDLLAKLNLLDTKRAVKIAGHRSYFLKGDLMLLEQAIFQFALNKMVGHGFTPFAVPLIVREEAFQNTGYGPWGMEDIFWTQDEGGLIGTAEVPLTAYHQGEVLKEEDLPIKMVGLSPCFRREVGSYGKDTQGIFRVHNFTKLEQVVYTVADEQITKDWHTKMLGFAEEILRELGLAYQVVLMCTGDMGAGQRFKYDIEVWFPGQNKYRETHSDSYFNDFQARRLNIRYQAKDGTVKYVYTINNTVIASPRILAAIAENYQTKEGRIKVPDALKPYLNKKFLGA
jgi:seryl-tRNA synthetase